MTRIMSIFWTVLALSVPARADLRTYDEFSFRRASLEKKIVVLDFHAKWCPKCRAGSPILETVLAQKKFEGIYAYVVDFRNDRKADRKFDVEGELTVLVTFQGRELERVTGQIRHEALQGAIESAIEKARKQLASP
jgi:thiol-disulfide isomerase/thioredoxin